MPLRTRDNDRIEGVLGGVGLDQFNSIAERIVDEGAFDAREHVVPGDRHPVRGERREQRLVVPNAQGRVRLARGGEGLFDAQVQLKVSALEPEAAARGRGLRLGQLLEAQKAAVEAASRHLLALGHRQLDMIESDDMNHDVLPFARARHELRLRDECDSHEPRGKAIRETAAALRDRSEESSDRSEAQSHLRTRAAYSA